MIFERWQRYSSSAPSMLKKPARYKTIDYMYIVERSLHRCEMVRALFAGVASTWDGWVPLEVAID